MSMFVKVNMNFFSFRQNFWAEEYYWDYLPSACEKL